METTTREELELLLHGQCTNPISDDWKLHSHEYLGHHLYRTAVTGTVTGAEYRCGNNGCGRVFLRVGYDPVLWKLVR